MPHKITVIGLGYVGLPLAVEFAKKFSVTGFDIKPERTAELEECRDSTLELTPEQLKEVMGKGLKVTCRQEDIKDSNIYIVTVPTPIDKHKRPDMTPLLSASRTVGEVLKKGDIVIYESTVYPGATEEECVPVLEKHSGLKFNADFFCGYSPERINPGDKEHTVTKIKKITSGSTPETAKTVDELYKSIITAGTHMTESIKVAEAAKVIENTQRDVNIAFVNELSLIFNRMNIDTEEVIKAASTKWNFLPFRPGLVGGHCIGVDPYYLAHKAQELGYNPEIILAGRRLNDNMGAYVAGQVIKLLIKKGHRIDGLKVLVLGITFKENCPDIRNSRVIDVITELKEFGCCVDVYDPWADREEVKTEYGIEAIEAPQDFSVYGAVVLAVAHSIFRKYEPELEKLRTERDSALVVYDVKSFYEKSDGRL